MNFNFAEWLKKEMTSAASVGGGGTSTADIAGFARKIFSEPIRRNPDDKKKKDKH